MHELFVGFGGQIQYTFTIWSLFTIILSFENLCHNLNCNILFYAFIFSNKEFLPNKNQKNYDKNKHQHNDKILEKQRIYIQKQTNKIHIVCLRMKCISLESVFKMYSMISFLLYFFEQMIRLLLFAVVDYCCGIFVFFFTQYALEKHKWEKILRCSLLTVLCCFRFCVFS